MKRDWVAIKMTPKMAKAILDTCLKSLGGSDKLLRRRLYRVASLTSTDYGYVVVKDEAEARALLAHCHFAAFGSAHRLTKAALHQSTKAALFDRIAMLNRFLERSIVDTIALLGKPN